MPLHWLQDKGSMTAALRHYDAALSIEVLYEAFEVPNFLEREALNLSADEAAFVREVMMLGHGMPWVYARSVLHPKLQESQWKGLFHLGARPMGEILFTDPNIQRIRLQPIDCPQHYSARASLFLLDTLPLYMVEIFLPKCPLYTLHP